MDLTTYNNICALFVAEWEKQRSKGRLPDMTNDHALGAMVLLTTMLKRYTALLKGAPAPAADAGTGAQ